MNKIYPKDFLYLSRALHLHFDEGNEFDAIKYRFKTKSISNEKFESLPEFRVCVNISKRCKDFDTARRYITANCLEENTCIFNYTDEAYVGWLGRMQSLRYHMTSQLKDISDDFDDLFKFEGEYPRIVNKFFEKKISFETIACINMITGFVSKISIADPLIWPLEKYKIQQYTTLFVMDVDRDKIRHQLVNIYKHK